MSLKQKILLFVAILVLFNLFLIVIFGDHGLVDLHLLKKEKEKLVDKNKKIGSLTDDEIKKISDFIKNPKVPEYIINRRSDFATGEDKHLSGSDLELQKEFDIKRLKKIKSYRGFRHMAGLPLRGQRTKSNFRPNKKKAGIKKKGKK